MSSIQQNSHSMLGINTLETDEITFGDGTTMSSTSNFASASDLDTVSAQATTNTASITDKQDAITAGDGLVFNGSTLNAEVQSSDLTSKQDAITSGNPLSSGVINFNTAIYPKPQLRIITYDKDEGYRPDNNVFNQWGLGSRNNVVKNDRRVGDSF